MDSHPSAEVSARTQRGCWLRRKESGRERVCGEERASRQRAHGYRQGIVQERGVARASHGYSVARAERAGQQLVIGKPGLSPMAMGSYCLLCLNCLLTLVCKVGKGQERKGAVRFCLGHKQSLCKLSAANYTVWETPPPSPSPLFSLNDL